MKKLIHTVLLICFTFSLNAAVHTISVANFSFSPSFLSVAVGDTIVWNWVSGSHTTTSQNVPAGAPTWNSNINSSTTSFQYIVTVAGAYAYVCTPHAGMGMAGAFNAVASGISTITNPDLSVRLNAEQQLTLNVQLPRSANINYSVLDVLGRVIVSENPALQSAGTQEYTVDVSALNSGYYFVRVVAGEKVLTRRIYIN